MHSKRASLVLIVLLLALVGSWWLLVRYTETAPSEEVAARTGTSPQAPALDAPIVVHHSMDGTNNLYSGIVTMTGGCGVLSSGIQAKAGHPAHVTLILLTAMDKRCTSQATSTTASFDVAFNFKDTDAPIFDGTYINGGLSSHTLVDDATQ